jgi:hypothetical protein
VKKSLILIACIFIALASCKKNANVTPANTISATINGVNENFNINTFAQLGSNFKVNSNLYIFGNNGSAVGADQLIISLITNQTLAPGSLTSGSNAVGLVSITYQDGAFSINNPAYITDLSGNQTTVIITSLTNNSVQGTFSGVLTTGNTTKTVTNGKFNLALKTL